MAHARTLIATIVTLAAAGCASTEPRLDSQWLAPQLPAAPMRGTKVLVACDVQDPAMRRVCQDQFAAQVAAQGATPVVSTDIAGAPGQPVADAQYLPAARAAGASVVLATTIGLADRRVSPGMMLGIGGWGIGSGRVRGGLGLSMPIGGGEVSNGYSANGRVTDTASGRLLWMGTASTPPSGDFNAQMAGLARTVVDAARRAGLF
jgi:hypothetical protein